MSGPLPFAVRVGPNPTAQGVHERAFDQTRHRYLGNVETDLEDFAEALDGEFLPCGWHLLASIRRVERKDGGRADDMREQRQRCIGAVRALHAIYRDTCKDARQTANELAIGHLLLRLVNESADRAAERAAEQSLPGDH
ncbi:MAG: hypothetical protein Q8Q73_19125 [Stagnimonas sp.]|nr:hypothetical protein [Stagnimonas sp.]